MIKEQLVAAIHDILNQKLEDAKSNFITIRESLESDSKSSAGDKHETARAMAQIELEQAGKQISEVEKLISLFKPINFDKSEQVKIGSLVKVNEVNYFISIPLSKIEVENSTVFCIGIQAPFAKLLLGKISGDQFSFNQKKFTIQSIC